MDLSQFIPDIVILALFILGIYSFSVLPRQREFRQRQKLVGELKLGTEVITYGGLVGTVRNIDTDNGVVMLEIAKGIEVKFLAQAISAEFNPQEITDSAKRAAK